MSKEKSIYEHVLEISKLADEIEFENRNKVNQEEDYIRKVINKPVETEKAPYKALEIYNKTHKLF